MGVMLCLLKWANLFAATSLMFFSAAAWSCDGEVTACIYSDGKFAPFEVKFTTETSAAGLNVNVNISQRLEASWFNEHWTFRTKITGFAYGLYGSIIDTSEFSILSDNSYQTQNFSRKAKVYGFIPIVQTSFKQDINWRSARAGHVNSRYKGERYRYTIEPGILDQALLPLQLRADLLRDGPDLGTKVYRATSKKHVDDDFMFRFVKEVELQTPLGTVPTVIYELLKGQHKDGRDSIAAGHDLKEIGELLDQLIALRQSGSGKQQEQQTQAVGEQLNALLNVDRSTIVSISEDDVKSRGVVSAAGEDDKGDEDGKSIIDKASEIEEGNARVFFWLSKKHAYLPVKMLAVIDSNSWSKVMIKSVVLNDVEVPYL